ncbi:MAG TPA: DUF4159 domain-containing protein [Longimicrobiales bacterium]|nr:DUF4159 domain-containing protein [Longimicrobiales bacterium]
MNVHYLQVLALTAAVLITAADTPRSASTPPLTIAQLQYDGGGDWYANPSGLPNLLRAIGQRTGLPVSTTPARTRLTDPSLWAYPYLFLTGHGNIRLSEQEVGLLRRYLLDGGFLHVDDNYGLDESFRREIRRVFPDRELEQIPPTHPVFNVMYPFPEGLPKIHRHDGAAPQAFGIFAEGRLVLFYSYETDLGNGWEDPEVHDDPPEAREAALRMGVNLFLYALSQVVT